MADVVMTSMESAINDRFGMISHRDAVYYRRLRELLQVRRLIGDGASVCRVGKANDGGYVMLDDFKSEGIAYSFGISDDVSWDSDMVDRGYEVYMYDHTIASLPKEKLGFHFFKQGLSGDDSSYPTMATVSRYLRENGHASKRNLILKMDVEGAEWDWLGSVGKETLEQFDQIVMELHWFTRFSLREKILAGIKKLDETHGLVHLHPNNYGRTFWVDGIPFPDVLEVLYVNRKSYDIDNTSRLSPGTNLDLPNWENRDEICLSGWEDPSRELQVNWQQEYAFSMQGSKWLKFWSVESRNRNGTGYCYLYLLYRILDEYRPQNILEFNFGQTTKMVAQYVAACKASHTVLEHDRERVEHFMRCWEFSWGSTRICGAPLLETRLGTETGVIYPNFPGISNQKQYDLVLLKCPFVEGVRIHLDLLPALPGILCEDFAILMDHAEDSCGRVVLEDMEELLRKNNIGYVRKEFYSRSRRVAILASKSWKYVEEF